MFLKIIVPFLEGTRHKQKAIRFAMGMFLKIIVSFLEGNGKKQAAI